MSSLQLATDTKLPLMTRLAYAVVGTYYKEIEFTKDTGAVCVYCGATSYHSTDINHISECIVPTAFDLVEEYEKTKAKGK